MKKIIVNPSFELTPKKLFEILNEELGEELIIKYDNSAKGDTVYITKKEPSDCLMIKIKTKTFGYNLRLHKYSLSERRDPETLLVRFALFGLKFDEGYSDIKEKVLAVLCKSKELKAEY